MIEQSSLVILGSGYSGRIIFPLAVQEYREVFVTSRAPDEHLEYIPAQQRLRFDLERPETWGIIPTPADLLWCFPASPIGLVGQFVAKMAPSPRRIVVLGSTSAYNLAASSQYPPPWIDETAPIDLTRPRVQGEEYLRVQHGAIVLRVAGIYGPGRSPVDWIRRGQVSPSRKYVNLIHVEDLAAICLAALKRGKAGEVYNVSDGTPRTWDDIYLNARERWILPPLTGQPSQEVGKRIAIEKLHNGFGRVIRHVDLFAALDTIERR